jgi:Type II CAAX prenyl endopeptidase Rce1-like
MNTAVSSFEFQVSSEKHASLKLRLKWCKSKHPLKQKSLSGALVWNRLVREFGLRKGLLLLGILWGAWPVPIYYFMGEFPQHPIFGPFVMTPIDNILAVVPMAWFYIKGKNIWVPTLAHAFADVVWGFSNILFPSHHEIGSWVVLQTAQLIVSIILLINLRSRSGEAYVAELKASPGTA